MAQGDWGAAEPLRRIANKAERFLTRENQPMRGRPNATVRALNRAADEKWREEVRKSFERPATKRDDKRKEPARVAKRGSGRSSSAARPMRRVSSRRKMTRGVSRRASRI